ncbi:MAG TPA: SpoIIE family protein phosphatase [Pirellulales bacterium]|nr:SpoIIE family protein phosphatase [Pirellulales bacterium]
MPKSIPAYLRLFNEQIPPAKAATASFDLGDVCVAFEHVTGWSLYDLTGDAKPKDVEVLWSAPVEPGAEGKPGHLRVGVAIASGESAAPHADLPAAAELATAIARLWRELQRTREALRQREAELAAGVPVAQRPEGERGLADRLEQVLRGGAEAAGCHAAALYLLDAGTTELKLRSSWGLPAGRLTAPARPLERASADLEALAGHAIVLENAADNREWNLPESFPAAVCVPVSTPTTPLGTLWLFGNQSRPFSDAEVNVVELAAGRIAADLEREMLLNEGIEGAKLKQQLAAAERFEQNQRPHLAPLVEAWDVAGWTAQAAGVGGDFYDWFVRADDRLALALGDSSTRAVEAALAASGLRAALRSHAEYVAEPGRLLERLNQTLWTGSAGDQTAALFYALAEAETGRLQFAAAGGLAALALSPDGAKSLLTPTTLLGLMPDGAYETCKLSLSPGGSLLVVSEGVCAAFEEQGRQFGDRRMIEALLPRLGGSADELVECLRDQLEGCAASGRYDRTILAAKCRVGRQSERQST